MHVRATTMDSEMPCQVYNISHLFTFHECSLKRSIRSYGTQQIKVLISYKSEMVKCQLLDFIRNI